MSMKGKGWDYEQNKPSPELIKFLDEKVAFTRRRIKEVTGVDIEPIYYVAEIQRRRSKTKALQPIETICFYTTSYKTRKKSRIHPRYKQR